MYMKIRKRAVERRLQRFSFVTEPHWDW